MHQWIGCLLTLLCANLHAAQSCSVHSTSQRQSLIELYTSEGCSSCPPADRWLANLPDDPSWIALAFHVDYWDRLGWKDRFGSPAYTQRQHRSAQLRGSRRVYTPQVIADGLEHARWYSQALPRRDQPDSPVMTLSLRQWDGDLASIEVLVEPDDLSDAVVRVAMVENGLSSQVSRGENGGRTLQHAHVVRSLESIEPSERVQLQLPIPTDLVVTQAALVAWIEDRRKGAPRQALRLPLDACTDLLASQVGGSR